AARSPCSWYRRSSSLSLSPPGALGSHRDFLREADPVPVHVHVVDGRLEHAAKAERLAALALDLVEQPGRERADARLERTVAHRHPNGDLTHVGVEAVEDRIERDLEVLENL